MHGRNFVVKCGGTA